jgi:hypothetical protein
MPIEIEKNEVQRDPKIQYYQKMYGRRKRELQDPNPISFFRLLAHATTFVTYSLAKERKKEKMTIDCTAEREENVIRKYFAGLTRGENAPHHVYQPCAMQTIPWLVEQSEPLSTSSPHKWSRGLEAGELLCRLSSLQ